MKEKSYIIKCKKVIWQNSTLTKDKNSQKNRTGGNFLNDRRTPLWKRSPYLLVVLNGGAEDLKCFLWKTKVDKISANHISFNIVTEMTNSAVRRKKYTYQGKNKIVPICRWHDFLCREFQGIYEKISARTNKWIQHGSRYKINI